MEEQKSRQGGIRVTFRSRKEAMADYAERIRYCEEKYGISSAEMRNLISTGDDKCETPEILEWMSADRAYRRLLQAETPRLAKLGQLPNHSPAAPRAAPLLVPRQAIHP